MKKCKGCQWYGKPYWSIINPCDNCPKDEINVQIITRWQDPTIDTIKLEQTKKIFKVLADLINKKETCSYRYLIYELLGFDESNYIELLDGMTITNFLVDHIEEDDYGI